MSKLVSSIRVKDEKGNSFILKKGADISVVETKVEVVK